MSQILYTVTKYTHKHIYAPLFGQCHDEGTNCNDQTKTVVCRGSMVSLQEYLHKKLKIQRMTLKIVPELKDLQYEEILKEKRNAIISTWSEEREETQSLYIN